MSKSCDSCDYYHPDDDKEGFCEKKKGAVQETDLCGEWEWWGDSWKGTVEFEKYIRWVKG